jgi:hypothetical protein
MLTKSSAPLADTLKLLTKINPIKFATRPIIVNLYALKSVDQLTKNLINQSFPGVPTGGFEARRHFT